MVLFIKNMVCDRCIIVVKQRLAALSFPYEKVDLGEVYLAGSLSDNDLNTLQQDLRVFGFDVLNDRKSCVVSQIKTVVIRHVYSEDENLCEKKLSVVLSEKLDQNYHYLSSLFSSSEGTTIEKYLILLRVERVKELLGYNELNLNEISYKLGYNSVQHLSLQFKKITGLTPSQYKNSMKKHDRRRLDQVGF